VHEYKVPLADASVAATALKFENLAAADAAAKPVLSVKDGDKQGILEILMPSSFPALKGEIALDAAVGEGGEIGVYFSDNNGLDWKSLAKIDKSGEQKIDFSKQVIRRYDYRVRFVMKGKGTGLSALKIVNDIQHSQRPLPILEAGENTITFSAGPQEGVVTIEGSCFPKDNKGLNLTWKDFHPEVTSLKEDGLIVDGEKGEIVQKLQSPGDIAWITLMTHYRARGKNSGWDVSVSYDEGKTWKDAAKCVGPVVFNGVFTEIKDVPAGTKSVWVKHAGYGGGNGVMLFNQRIDAHYKLPSAGFRPVKITYVWEEGGIEKKDEHIAKQAADTYKIKLDGKPDMKSIIMELAD